MPVGGFHLQRPIALVGLMAAGKSAVGRLLADRLGLDFVDTDTAIEQAVGMDIGSIFKHHGDVFFREKEREVFGRLDLSRPKVFATGGGAFADEALRSRLLERCLTIWLDCPIPVLVERASWSETRPMLEVSDPIAVLKHLAEERGAFYAMADFRVESDKPLEQVVEQILCELHERRV